MTSSKRGHCLSAILIYSLCIQFGVHASRVKVFVLAGQSNMVGCGSIDHLDVLVNCSNASSNEFRDALWNGTAYKERDDVYIKFNLNHGALSASRTAGYAGRNFFGPELMFGWTVGDAVDDKVLLIKTAWGGKSLAIDFRPPSAGEGNYSGVKPVQYGWLYRAMILDTLDTLTKLATYVPDYDESSGYELAGFVWFQGWNDMLNEDTVNEYGPNLVKIIRDIRLDLDAPHLPFSKLFVELYDKRCHCHHSHTSFLAYVENVF